ncbi:hypothetical protein [Desulfosporosinus fructosivorans]
MWPKRKIQLVASSAAPGINGVRAVLKGMKLEFFEAEDLSGGIIENWWEKPFDQKAATEEAGPVTDIIFWSEGRENAFSEGLNQQSIESFIHNILEDYVILKVSEPTILIEGRPLLGHVLHEAGFEPTILWPTTDGDWQCERKQGNHWVIPESWQVGSCEARRATNLVPPSDVGAVEKVTWEVRADRIDFYQGQDGLKFVGQVPRWPELMEEHVAAQTIARCIELGVSWLDIRLALSSFWQNVIITDNLRWNINDIGWNGWTGGEELPSAPIDHVEDWWAR